MQLMTRSSCSRLNSISPGAKSAARTRSLSRSGAPSRAASSRASVVLPVPGRPASATSLTLRASQRLDRRQDGARRVALVERVEVHARRTGLEQAPALADRVLDADRHHDRGVLLEALQARAQLLGDPGPAHLREALDLRDARDRHDARHDRDGDPCLARALDEAEVVLAVEEELRDQELGPALDLVPGPAQVVVSGARLGVLLGVAGAADAEALLLAHEGRELARVREAPRRGRELAA